MSESVTVTPEAGPAIPPETSQPAPANELFAEASTPTQGSVFEKVKRAGATIFEKYGVIYKRGPGRPRKDGLPAKNDLPLNAPQTALPAAAAAGAPLPAEPGLDPALVKKCCSAVIKALTGFLDKLLFNKAKRKTGDAKFAQQLVTDATITQPEIDAFSELAEVCLRKYGVGTQYAPEIGLAALVLGIGIRYGAAMKALDQKPDAGEPAPTP
jgi:hypothetical protein